MNHPILPHTSSSIQVGPIVIGGGQATVIQSMLDKSPLLVESCVKEISKLHESGCGIIRIAVINKNEIKGVKAIKKALQKLDLKIGLVADVHFNSSLANCLVGEVDKIRINPGNYLGNPKMNWDEKSYREESVKIEQHFTSFLKMCQESRTAIRIGVNHGSLSDRMLYKYGNTATGMVESAMEFMRTCKLNNFSNAVVSLKSSNAKIMMESNQLLAKEMAKEDLGFPIHLGVTEAGSGVAGRIKSICGIGTLLGQGIGDTIRVSLTEDPEFEIQSAKSILNNLHHLTVVKKEISESDSFVLLNNPWEKQLKGTKEVYVKMENSTHPYHFRHLHSNETCLFKSVKSAADVKSLETLPIILDSDDWQNQAIRLRAKFPEIKLIAHLCPAEQDFDDFLSNISLSTYQLLEKNVINGIYLTSDFHSRERCDEIAMELMQFCGRLRFSPTYISCPSCSRTQFKLQEVTADIQKATAHLTGIKIGIMGCIINGIGEMMECDYGYVGAGKGLVNLYEKQNLVKRAVPEEEAVSALLNLIHKQHPVNEN